MIPKGLDLRLLAGFWLGFADILERLPRIITEFFLYCIVSLVTGVKVDV